MGLGIWILTAYVMNDAIAVVITATWRVPSARNSKLMTVVLSFTNKSIWHTPLTRSGLFPLVQFHYELVETVTIPQSIG